MNSGVNGAVASARYGMASVQSDCPTQGRPLMALGADIPLLMTTVYAIFDISQSVRVTRVVAYVMNFGV
jgi:hypothetical protein